MLDDVKFLKAYIQAIQKRLTIQQLSKRLKITYAGIMCKKKSIADRTGKKLPPLARPNKTVNPQKLQQLVSESYSVYKTNQK